MPPKSTPVCDFGWNAEGFSLPATDGKTYTLEDIAGPNGTLIMFICNHCPFVKAILGKIVRDGRDLQALGIGVAAISSNDTVAYPADSFDEMKKVPLPFPYLYDEDQSVARAYGAVCTPDFFGFNADLGLQYRGRLDESRAQPAPDNLPRDLYEAMKLVAETGQGPSEQVPSIGCSIKWKSNA